MTKEFRTRCERLFHEALRRHVDLAGRLLPLNARAGGPTFEVTSEDAEVFEYVVPDLYETMDVTDDQLIDEFHAFLRSVEDEQGG